jgi:CheY-like chemotaxis protein
VDDNAFNIEVLKFLILKIDPMLRIECSLDAPTAIQMVKLNRCNKCRGYEKVFMDIDMPTMNGL